MGELERLEQGSWGDSMIQLKGHMHLTYLPLLEHQFKLQICPTLWAFLFVGIQDIRNPIIWDQLAIPLEEELLNAS